MYINSTFPFPPSTNIQFPPKHNGIICESISHGQKFEVIRLSHFHLILLAVIRMYQHTYKVASKYY